MKHISAQSDGQITGNIHTLVAQIYQEQGHSNPLNLSSGNQNVQCIQHLKMGPKEKQQKAQPVTDYKLQFAEKYGFSLE
jgi:predicted DNA-binding ribbon-helix-helix protein